MRFTFDANIVIYAQDPRDARRQHQAQQVIERAAGRDCVIALQTLGETFSVLTRKLRLSIEQAQTTVERLAETFDIVAAAPNQLLRAIGAVRDHGMSFWDAMLWATASAARCRMIISQDYQPRRTVGTILYVDPFADDLAPELEAALSGS